MYIIYTGYRSENLSKKCLPITPLPSWVSNSRISCWCIVYYYL